MKPFVTSMTLLPDQSRSIAPTSLKATAPTTTRMTLAATAWSIVTALMLAPSLAVSSPRVSGPRELAMWTGTVFAAKKRASVTPNLSRAYEGVRNVDLHIDCCKN